EEEQILLDRQTPIESTLLRARQAHLRAHALLIAHAVEAVDRHRARCRLYERRHDLRERRLARAVARDETEDLALAHLEADIMQSFSRPLRRPAPEDLFEACEWDRISLREMFDLDRNCPRRFVA